MTLPLPTPSSALLSFEQGDAKWHEYRERCKNDLYWLCSVVLGFANVFALEADTHFLPLRFLERKTGVEALDTAPIQLILWPRDTGKSTCGTIGAAIQEALKDPDISILIANEKADIASGFLAAIKHQFDTNELLRALFPEVLRDPNATTPWSTEKAQLRRSTGRPEATFEVIGVGGTITGKHFGRIFCDDLISKEAMENARAGDWTVMDRVNRWVTTLRPLLSSSAKPFPWIRFIGTRWWARDTYETIETVFGHEEDAQPYILKIKLPSGVVVRREAYRVGDLAVLKIKAIEDGKAVYPKIHSLDALSKMRQEDPEMFACWMMNDPSDEAVRSFSDDWLKGHYWEWAGRGNVMYSNNEGGKRHVALTELAKMMVVDPAFAVGKEESARTAIVVVGSDLETGKQIVLDVFASRIDPKDSVDEILTRAKRWGVSRLFIEAVAQQAGFIRYVQSEAQRRNISLPVDEVKPGGRNKDTRILGLVPHFRNGTLYVHASQHDLLDEYRKYRPGARLRDVLDALAYAPEYWYGATQGTMDPKKRAALQLQSYRERRGLTLSR